VKGGGGGTHRLTQTRDEDKVACKKTKKGHDIVKQEHDIVKKGHDIVKKETLLKEGTDIGRLQKKKGQSLC